MAFTRRDFIKSSIATAVAANGLVLFSPQQVFGSDTQVIPSAGHFGPFKAVVKNGVLIGIQPLPDVDAMPTEMLVKGLLERVYHSTRVASPMIRKSWLENRGGDRKTQLRGREPFVRVSWEEALSLTAEAILSTAEAHGNESLFSASYSGWAHAGLLRPHTLQGRLFGLIGGQSITTGNYSFGAAMHSLPHVISGTEIFSPQTAWEVIAEKTEMMVLVGCDPWKGNLIDYNVADHQMYPKWHTFRKKGIRFVSINPQYTATDAEMDSDWVQIRPNTDTALFLAMAYHVYTTDKVDKDYISRYTTGFEEYVSHLLGKADGVAKTPAWAAKITGVPAKKIEELADLCASKKTQIAAGWALQRARHGEMVHWAIINFAAILGKIGRPGEGAGFSWHYSGSGMPMSMKRMPTGLPEGMNPVKTRCPASRITEMLMNPGGEYQQSGVRGQYPDVKLIYTAGNNFMSHQPDTNRLIKAMNRQVDTVVCQDPWWCASARFADIVLPATTTLERNDISSGGLYSSDKIYAMRQVIAPYQESLDDFEIFRRLGDLMGVGFQFTEGLSVMDILKNAYANSDAAEPFEEFWEKGIVHLEVPDVMRQWVLHGDFVADPKKNPLPTASGRIELYSETIQGFAIDDCPPVPTFLAPEEYLGHAKSGQLHVLSPHPTDRLHSQMANTALRHKRSIKGRQYVQINPADAKARGIRDNDLVEIHNDRGALIAGAQLSDQIMPGVIAVEEGNWLQLDSRGRCNSGAINIITSDVPSSGLSLATSANSCLAYIKKCKDPESDNRAFEPPAIEQQKQSATPQEQDQQLAARAEVLRRKQLKDMSPGEKLFYERCTRCHVAQQPEHYTKAQWDGLTKIMFERAGLDEAERKLVRDFIYANAMDSGM